MKIKTIIKSGAAAALVAAIGVSQLAQGDTYYFALTGSDGADCTGGTSGAPWRSLTLKYNAGCIGAGDTAIVKSGTYPYDDVMFVGPGGRIAASGEDGNPLLVQSETQYGAVFVGGTAILGSYITMDGFEFKDAINTGTAVVSISETANVTITNSKIHGSFNPYVPGTTSAGDCIKVAAGGGAITDVTITHNEIYDCSEDAADWNGVDGLVITDNEIHDAAFIQIKGGNSDVEFSRNTVYNLWAGILGNGMNCSQDLGKYCGNANQVGIDVAARHQTSTIKMDSNTFTDIDKTSIDISGWRYIEITNNTFNSPYTGHAYIRARPDIGSVYYDFVAGDFCARYPAECNVCTDKSGKDCWAIPNKVKSIYIAGNTTLGSNDMFNDFQADAIDPWEWCIYNNDMSVDPMREKVEGVTQTLVQSETDCNPSGGLGE